MHIECRPAAKISYGRRRLQPGPFRNTEILPDFRRDVAGLAQGRTEESRTSFVTDSILQLFHEVPNPVQPEGPIWK